MNCLSFGNILVEQVNCIQQQHLSCVFHAIANARKLEETNGQLCINDTEARSLETKVAAIEDYMHSIGRCAGIDELEKYRASGGIIVNNFVIDKCENSPKFENAIKDLMMGQLERFSFVLKFMTHAVALYATKTNEIIKFKIADSDSPSSIHPHTRQALSGLVMYCQNLITTKQTNIATNFNKTIDVNIGSNFSGFGNSILFTCSNDNVYYPIR